ncbi:sugar nucleotide-binding protein [Agarivorans sp. JK6]|uniref:sugar nucleotide-binding protein n=1 Tax=Agarivorans sp. JK6 TaxID=2997426 RepID=UPI003872BCCA
MNGHLKAFSSPIKKSIGVCRNYSRNDSIAYRCKRSVSRILTRFSQIARSFIVNAAAHTSVDKAQIKLELAGTINAKELKYLAKMASNTSQM